MLQGQQFRRPSCFPFPDEMTNSSGHLQGYDTPTLGQLPRPSIFSRMHLNKSQILENQGVKEISPKRKAVNYDEKSTKKKQVTYFPMINDGLLLRKKSKFMQGRVKKQASIIPKDYIFRRVSTQPDNSLEYYLKKSKQKQKEFMHQKPLIGKNKKTPNIHKQKKFQKIHFSVKQMKRRSSFDQKKEKSTNCKLIFTSLKTQYSYKRQALMDIYTDSIRESRVLGKNQVRIPQIPRKYQLSSFLINYRTNNEDIDIQALLKANFCAIEYSESELYIGEMIGKHKNGIGILITRKSCFEGEWKGNAKVKGVEVTHQGVYKGHYAFGKREGTGEYHRHAGDIYVGEWKAGKQHGTGLWINELGSSYNGSWVQGKVEGMGTLSLKKRNYKGWFVNFRQSGFGKQTFINGDSFQGIFKDDLPNGKGVYRWKDGSSFEGHFVDGMREGWGQLKVNSQIVYCGQFRRDRPEGDCQIFMKNRAIWKGLARRGESKSVNMDHSRQKIRQSIQMLGSGVEGVYRI